MTDARHDEFTEAAAAYALGALDAAERELFEAHLRTCAACAAEVDAYRQVAAGIGAGVEPVPPPPGLKARVIATATAASSVRALERPVGTPARPAPRLFAWLAAAACIVLAVAAGVYAWAIQAQLLSVSRVAAEASSRADALRSQLSAVRREVARTTRLLDVVTAPDVWRVSLAGTKRGSAAKGQAYWSPSRGVWFTADGLPVLSPGRTYQLWLVLPKQAPMSAGLLGVDARGSGTMLSAAGPQTDVAKPSVVTFAITEEPAAGSPGPTSPILLAGSAKPDASRP